MHNIWELISKDCVNDWTQDASLKLANNAAVDRGVRELKSRLSDNLKARTEYLEISDMHTISTLLDWR